MNLTSVSPNYSDFHLHIAFNFHLDGLIGQCGLQMASEVTSGFGFELSVLNNHLTNVTMILWPLIASMC